MGGVDSFIVEATTLESWIKDYGKDAKGKPEFKKIKDV